MRLQSVVGDGTWLHVDRVPTESGRGSLWRVCVCCEEEEEGVCYESETLAGCLEFVWLENGTHSLRTEFKNGTQVSGGGVEK